MTYIQQLAAVAGAARHATSAPRVVTGAAVRGARTTLDGLGRRILRQVGERVDLTPLVSQVVDLDRLVAGVDVDAVVDRLDLVSIVEAVLAEIDLPEIIRESTGSMASDTLTGVRLQGISADEAVTRVTHRLLLRAHRSDGDAAPTIRT